VLKFWKKKFDVFRQYVVSSDFDNLYLSILTIYIFWYWQLISFDIDNWYLLILTIDIFRYWQLISFDIDNWYLSILTIDIFRFRQLISFDIDNWYLSISTICRSRNFAFGNSDLGKTAPRFCRNKSTNFRECEKCIFRFARSTSKTCRNNCVTITYVHRNLVGKRTTTHLQG
jgi:hypothetical protein